MGKCFGMLSPALHLSLLGSDNPDYPQRVLVPLASIRSLFHAERLLSRHLS